MKDIDPAQDIVPLTEFRSKVSDYINQAKTTGRPVVITQHGHGSAVLISAEEYSQLKNTIEVMRASAKAHNQIIDGKTSPHDEVMKRIKKKLDRKVAEVKSRKKSA